MFFSPVSVLRVWILGVLAIAVLGLSAYLFTRWYDELPREKVIVIERDSEVRREVRALRGPMDRMVAWRPGADKATALLAAAAFLLAWSLLGHWVNPRLFRRAGSEKPAGDFAGETRKIASIDGTVIHVKIVGPPDAQPVLLTHGWSCDSEAWSYLAPHLRDRYRLILWDLPGLGQSTAPANLDFSLEKMAADLRAVLDETYTKPVVLVGHSIGGMIMLTFCRLFPDSLNQKVSGLVLSHTTYTNPLHTMSFSRLFSALQKPVIEPLLHLTIWFSPVVRLMNYLSYLNGSAHWSTERNSFAGTETREQLDFAARYTINHSPAILARGGLGMLRYDASDVLASIETPSLVIVGDKDQVTKPEAGRHIDATIPDSRYYAVSPAKHLGIIERHSELGDVIEQFIDGASTVHGSQKVLGRPQSSTRDRQLS